MSTHTCWTLQIPDYTQLHALISLFLANFQCLFYVNTAASFLYNSIAVTVTQVTS